MFFEALQAYYAPTVLLLFFASIVICNQFLTRREKKLFLIEMGIVGLMILSTWVDRCISAIPTGEWWKIRFFTSVMQFAIAPLSPLTLLWIYWRNQSSHINGLLILPALITAVLSFSSFWTGLVLQVVPGNIYSRGPLFLLPFLSSGIYIVVMLHTTTHQHVSGRKLEALFLFFAGCAIAGACILEILFVIRYMIWSTTAVMLVTYFLIVTTQKVLYDSLTGVFSRIAFTRRMESTRDKQQMTMAMIDVNNLKLINDRYGHKQGDKALKAISQALLSLPLRGKKTYRYGGDEFVIVLKGCCGQALTTALERICTNYGAIEDTSLSFAYGVVEYCGGDLHKTTDEMDKLMYQNKASMKAINNMQKPAENNDRSNDHIDQNEQN